ncbi:hypothetical protein LQZ18_02750 [Lachnospiraceae bacterium ZAX-1]
MSERIVELENGLKVASKAAGNEYRLIKGKKIMFESTLENGESIILCTPLSKYHDTIDAGWVDITLVQYELMESYDNAMLIFRIEGYKLSMVNWIDLKPLLIQSCMRYTKKSKEHWKLNIHDKFIKVSGNEKTLNVKAFIYTP